MINDVYNNYIIIFIVYAKRSPSIVIRLEFISRYAVEYATETVYILVVG